MAVLERLEKATEGSRELDAEVREAIYGPGSIITGLWPVMSLDSIPHYTTSIDAALTLKSDDFMFSVGNLLDDEGEEHHEFGAALFVYGHVSDKRDQIAHAATPALALCIACLRARARGGGE